MKIVVLAGGMSPERDVSLASGSLIANALREANHEVALVDLYKGLEFDDLDLKIIFKDKITGEPYSYEIKEQEPDLNKLLRECDNHGTLIGKNIIEICQFADVVFIALHGAVGENGKIQALFDILNIKYTGTGYEGSFIAMDKNITKTILQKESILTPDWMVIDESKVSKSDMEYINSKIELPCVIKPIDGGSSIGVSIVENQCELEREFANNINGSKLMVEQKIVGREFSVGILDGKALPVIEIIAGSKFFDYKSKYQIGLAKELCPADLTEEETKIISNLATKVHQILNLGSYSRIDFLRTENGQFYCIEANSLPGMAPTSLFPQEAIVAGVSYVELCDKIVKMALSK